MGGLAVACLATGREIRTSEETKLVGRLRRAAVLALAVAAALTGAGGSRAATVSVVMSGLDNPRGLAWGPEGGLYVAEAGTGGSGPCAPVARGLNCYGPTGAISRLWRGVQERVVVGLPSVITPGAGDVTGPHDIAFHGLGGGYVTVGWGGNPSARAGLGELGSLFGSLLKIEPSGAWRVAADVSAEEAAANPAGGPVDSNPYGLLAEPSEMFVTDAGGNDLLQVRASGGVAVVAVFPRVPAPPPFLQADAVPTEVERGPDGALYASELTGVPFTDGAAGVYRVVPGSAPTLVVGGFKTITDFTFGADGSLYVVEYATSPLFLGGSGALIRVAPDGARETVTTALNHPTGVTVGADGAIYVSNNGNVIGNGEVVRIEP